MVNKLNLAPHVNQPATVPPGVNPSVEQVAPSIPVDARNTPANCGDDGGDDDSCEIEIS
jgi:hypothetical protein